MRAGTTTTVRRFARTLDVEMLRAAVGSVCPARGPTHERTRAGTLRS